MKIEDIKLSEIFDVAILNHGFVQYVRDYQIEIETNWIDNLAGRYIITFTHCYEQHYQILVKDEFIKESWDDLYTDFQEWEKRGEPEGFLWATNWSLAYPGFEVIANSEKAKQWSKRLNQEMKECKLQTNSFELHLIYENFKLEKINDETDLIDKVMIKLD